MGCGCGKKGVVRNRRFKPTVGPASVQGGRAAGASPEALRQLQVQQTSGPGQSQRLDEQRRRIEKLRRDAIRRRLGR